jgi:plastocyanin
LYCRSLTLLALLLLAGCGALPPERRIDLNVTAAGYTQAQVTAQTGDQIFIRFRNGDSQAHSLTVDLPGGQRTVSAEDGVDAILIFPAPEAGTYRLFCVVPGHTEEAELVISEP